MNWHKHLMRIFAAIFLFMLSGAIVSHVLWRQPPLRGFGSSIFLYVAGVLILLAVEKSERPGLLCAGLLGFAAEVIGVRYGWLFGRYQYTEVLAPNWLGTPVVMICAWFILIAYIQQMMLPLRLAAFGKVLIGSAWMTVIDLLIDPLAAHPFNFWVWIDTGGYYGIPWRNFLGWFGVSAVIIGVKQLCFRREVRENFWVSLVGLGIIAFYAIAAFIYGYYLASVVGIGLSGIHAVMMRTKKGAFQRKSVRERLAH
jgi:putative membrane protein